jgi:hypothetical protein
MYLSVTWNPEGRDATIEDLEAADDFLRRKQRTYVRWYALTCETGDVGGKLHLQGAVEVTCRLDNFKQALCAALGWRTCKPETDVHEVTERAGRDPPGCQPRFCQGYVLKDVFAGDEPDWALNRSGGVSIEELTLAHEYYVANKSTKPAWIVQTKENFYMHFQQFMLLKIDRLWPIQFLRWDNKYEMVQEGRVLRTECLLRTYKQFLYEYAAEYGAAHIPQHTDRNMQTWYEGVAAHVLFIWKTMSRSEHVAIDYVARTWVNGQLPDQKQYNHMRRFWPPKGH